MISSPGPCMGAQEAPKGRMFIPNDCYWSPPKSGSRTMSSTPYDTLDRMSLFGMPLNPARLHLPAFRHTLTPENGTQRCPSIPGPPPGCERGCCCAVWLISCLAYRQDMQLDTTSLQASLACSLRCRTASTPFCTSTETFTFKEFGIHFEVPPECKYHAAIDEDGAITLHSAMGAGGSLPGRAAGRQAPSARARSGPAPC